MTILFEPQVCWTCFRFCLCEPSTAILSYYHPPAASGLRRSRVGVLFYWIGRLFRQICDEYIRASIVVVVTEIHSHARVRTAVVGQGYSHLERTLGKCTVAVIVKQKVRHSVVCDEDVGEIITVVVVERQHLRSDLFWQRYPKRSLTHVCECAVSYRSHCCDEGCFFHNS
jgi:hypothetical protein